MNNNAHSLFTYDNDSSIKHDEG